MRECLRERKALNFVCKNKEETFNKIDSNSDGRRRRSRQGAKSKATLFLHWSLDVSFKEDLNRARAGHSAQNLATVRRIALNLLTQEKTHKRGIACKRKTAGWNHKYLMEVLSMGKNQKTQQIPPS